VTRSACRLVVAAALVLAAGCRTSPPEATVSGTVLLDGEPLAGANVQFHPRDDLTLGLYYGKTDAQGRFTLRGRGGPAVKPGRYVVLVRRLVKKDGTPPRADEDQSAFIMPGSLTNTLPELYGDKGSSPHTVEVRPGHNDLPPIELKRRP
jgi:hypothetical protein